MLNAAIRVGQGYDLHRLVEGRPLIIGGVEIPHDKGLAGHSDADVLTHAIIDALLGAAAFGDIGGMFPDNDPEWKDADSMTLMQYAVSRVHEAHWFVCNVDCTIIAEEPKMAPHISTMRLKIAKTLRINPSAVSVKAKTNEGVDAIGRGEAIAAQAVLLLIKN
jgi:2-C-methyl-D-erythritol 2,4-cyclodiphosphate synthase